MPPRSSCRTSCCRCTSRLFIETNPAPAKYALSVLGKCAETVRLPMVPLADKTKAAVRDAMVHAGLVN